MVINIAIKGGLGNQLFQYALGYYLQKKYNATVFYDPAPLGFEGKDLTKRSLLLDTFIKDLAYTNRKTHQLFYTQNQSLAVRLYRKLFRNLNNYHYVSESNPFQLSLKKGTYYFDGYWQNAELASGIINQLNGYTEEILKGNKYYTLIKQEAQPVALHIRRGDYVINPVINQFHGHCDIQYYHEAMRTIEKKINVSAYFIFSDDLLWAKENLKSDTKLIFVEGNDQDPVADLFLMKSCAHQIISNSSFSCWASYLNINPDKIVIAPVSWTRKEKTQQLPLSQSTWTVI